MLGIALALASSASWGVSDFLGGVTSRRLPVLAVLSVSQPVGLALILVVALPVAGSVPPAGDLALAALAGLAGLAGLAAYYRALALGPIGVVAPVGALGVALPIAVGLARGDDPAAIQAAGMVVAVAGIGLAAAERDPRRRAVTARALGFAAVAALGFGTFLAAIAPAAGEDEAWALVAVRTAGVCGIVVAVATLGTGGVRPSRRDLPGLAAIGLFDVCANAAYAVATTHGPLSLVSVAGSLYPAVAAVLAAALLRERLAPRQRLGVVAALAGVALMASGG